MKNMNIYNHSYSILRSFPTKEVKVYDENYFNLEGNGTELNSFGIKNNIIIFKTDVKYLLENKTLTLEWTSEFNELKLPSNVNETSDELKTLFVELMFLHYSNLCNFVYSSYMQDPARFPFVLETKNMHTCLEFVEEKLSEAKLN
ncbi:MAG: hypothetical protein IPJ53_00360 [Saprospiraceae bacterium]|jgi:hypothetical protein|nr:hypothetical protein [Candidatus Vicinibacter affinis]